MTKEKKKSKEGLGYAMQMSLAKLKNDYIRSTINGRYFLARCNMLAEQIQNKDIKENIDGCKKTEEFMRTEYALQKMQAIVEMRNAHFAKTEMVKDFNLTDDDIFEIEKDYYDGKIIRETYNEEYKKGNKAAFTKKSKE